MNVLTGPAPPDVGSGVVSLPSWPCMQDTLIFCISEAFLMVQQLEMFHVSLQSGHWGRVLPQGKDHCSASGKPNHDQTPAETLSLPCVSPSGSSQC